MRFTPEARGEKKRWVATSFFGNWRPYALGVASAVAVVIVASAVLVPKMLSRLAAKPVIASHAEVATPARADAATPSDSGTSDSGSARLSVARLQQANTDAEKRLDFLR